ncbi:MAG: hypothetical protein IJS20_07325 [Bacteroidales bacterium]|nr:hypothetical protein [Bacteroidales bacterium]
MRKIEIVSLALLVVAVVTLVLALQLDYGSARRWLTWLSFGLLIWSIDPQRPWKLMRKKKAVEEQEEPEESGPGYISLGSEVSVSRITHREMWLGAQDVYLKFLDIESDDYYYMHFVAGKAAETYVGGAYYLENQDFDELFEGYETIDGVLEASKQEEIENLSWISVDDFAVVRRLYQEQQTSSILSNPPVTLEEEPVNRVGKVIAYLLVAFAVLGFVWAVI